MPEWLGFVISILVAIGLILAIALGLWGMIWFLDALPWPGETSHA